ncbi:PREDICTED: ancient ubiquitous protein 1-like [Acropora digitifera]|uniref:ancient ubiquitous protein 1-like n=1 Tax=Acropora digitifera TaxID=70779 RepID=UPI00077A408D|nr:PREDICTED: ancient ubiquitous protein 1-like [Acropora digitifera]
MALKDLFFLNRFPDGGALFLLLFYIPCGLLLVTFRFFLGLQLLLMMSILPKESLVKRILFRVSCYILGVAVTQEGVAEHYLKGQHKVHCREINCGIIMAKLMVTNPFSQCDCPWLIKWALGYKDFHGNEQKENVDYEIKEYSQESSCPLLVFPEEQITTGKRGLLKFNPWGFQFSDTVLPVLISVRRPLMVQVPAVSYGVAGGRIGSGSCLFRTHIFISGECFLVLPPIELALKDCSDVQKHMASALGVAATNYSSDDVNELMKQIESQSKGVPQAPIQASQNVRSIPRDTGNATPNTRLTRMVKQVRDVLPQVPSTVIARDLSRTHCVDTTIANILEGRVSYVPEKESNHTEINNDVKTSSTTLSNETAPTKPQPVTFSRSPEERQKLLNQRKVIMLENARRRFAGTINKEI